MDKKDETKRVAIACQGGRSRTAFTAGVVKTILKDKKEKYEIAALSGTSGGAICAAPSDAYVTIRPKFAWPRPTWALAP